MIGGAKVEVAEVEVEERAVVAAAGRRLGFDRVGRREADVGGEEGEAQAEKRGLRQRVSHVVADASVGRRRLLRPQLECEAPRLEQTIRVG